MLNELADIYQDLDEILLYLWEDEQDSYLAHNEQQDGHIFEAVKRVRAWLDARWKAAR